MVIALFEINIGVWLVRCHVTSNKTAMTCPAELASFNVAHSDDAIMHSEGNYLFTGVVSVTLNFHPQGRNVNDVTNEGKS